MLKAYLSIPLIKLTRIDRPTGIFLLFWPCAFSIALFAPNDYHQLALFFIGSCIMRSSGCIINDLLDRNLDKQVERTKNRPLACGQVSIKSSLMLLAALLLCGLAILLQLNWLAIKIGLLSSVMVATYPLIKRISYFPQVFLGLTFNIGALIAAANTTGGFIPFAAIMLYIACAFWTIGYDTVYGFLDIKDDKKAGIKSLAIKIQGKYAKLWLASFYSVFAFCIIYSKLLTSGTVSLLTFTIWPFLLYLTYILDLDSSSSCQQHFSLAPFVGLAVFIQILL